MERRKAAALGFTIGPASKSLFSRPTIQPEEPLEVEECPVDWLPAKSIKDSKQSVPEEVKYEIASPQPAAPPWRRMEWTEDRRTSLMETISCYRPSSAEVPRARVLLLGPVGSGKSSFISSVQSVFNGRVTNRAMVGSSSGSFTKKLQCFNIHGPNGEDPTGLTLCDMAGLGGGGLTGPTLHDILSVIKGHVPEGHKFSPDQPVRSETVGYVKKPSLKEKIHCVAFVVDASKVQTYPEGLGSSFQQLREHISDLGVHQVALLTHVDRVCPATGGDASRVYESRVLQDALHAAAALLGMSSSSVVPVKNFSSQLLVDLKADVLLLSAVELILQYAELHFLDAAPPHTGPKME